MDYETTPRIVVVLAAVLLLVLVIGQQPAAAEGIVLFNDNFESDTAATLPSVDDLDPVIGSGDVGGSWYIQEASAAGIQVADNPPGALPNNAVRMLHYGAFPYNWDRSATTNQIIKASLALYRPTYGQGSYDTFDLGAWDAQPFAWTSAAPKLWEIGFQGNGSVTYRATDGYHDAGISYALDAWQEVSITTNLSGSTMTLQIGSSSVELPRFHGGDLNAVQCFDFGCWDPGQHVYLDNVRLEVIPEPSSLVLLAAGGFLVLILRRGRAG